MRFNKWISIKSIIHEWVTDLGNSTYDYSEEWIIRMVLSCLDSIGIRIGLEHVVSLIEVDNYKAILPLDFMYLDAAAYNYSPYLLGKDNINSVLEPVYGKECFNKETKTVILDDHFKLSSLYDHSVNYSRALYTSANFKSVFKPLRRATGKFDDLKFHIKGCVNLNVTTSEHATYSIKNGVMVTNFPKGEVLISYWRFKTDEEGYPMIPDNSLIINSLVAYLDERKAKREYDAERTPSNRTFWTDMKFERQEKLGIARSHVINSIDTEEMEYLTQMHTNLFPQDRYNNFWMENVRPNYRRERYTPYTRDTNLHL